MKPDERGVWNAAFGAAFVAREDAWTRANEAVEAYRKSMPPAVAPKIETVCRSFVGTRIDVRRAMSICQRVRQSLRYGSDGSTVEKIEELMAKGDDNTRWAWTITWSLQDDLSKSDYTFFFNYEEGSDD